MTHSPDKEIIFAANDVDGAYLLGVFNTGGLDKLAQEIDRLKAIGLMPHQVIALLKTADKLKP